MMEKLVGATRSVARLIAYCSSLLIFFAALVTLLDIFMRSFLRLPIHGANDVILMALTLAVIGYFPLMIESGHHMKIDVLGKAFGARFRMVIEGFANMLTLLVLAGFAWQFWLRGERLHGYDERSQMLQLPMAPLWWIAASFMAVAVLAQILILLTGRFDQQPERIAHPKESN